MTGELNSSQIQAVMTASALGTVHEGTYNLDYAWRMVRLENADIFLPSGVQIAEDIISGLPSRN